MRLYQDKARKFVPKAFGMKHYENPEGTKIINDLTALSRKRSGCLATHSFSFFLKEMNY
jgi:hypothetical protein